MFVRLSVRSTISLSLTRPPSLSISACVVAPGLKCLGGSVGGGGERRQAQAAAADVTEGLVSLTEGVDAHATCTRVRARVLTMGGARRAGRCVCVFICGCVCCSARDRRGLGLGLAPTLWSGLGLGLGLA